MPLLIAQRKLLKTQINLDVIYLVSQTYSVGVRNLIKARQKYLFRSLLPTQRTPSGVLFALAGAIVALKLDPRAMRCGIRFAFAVGAFVGERLGAPVF